VKGNDNVLNIIGDRVKITLPDHKGTFTYLNNSLYLEFPVGVKAHSFKAEVDFGLHINLEGRMKLGYSNESKLLNFNCTRNRDWCVNVKNYLTHGGFVHQVLTFNDSREHAFDQPAAARMQMGILELINYYTRDKEL